MLLKLTTIVSSNSVNRERCRRDHSSKKVCCLIRPVAKVAITHTPSTKVINCRNQGRATLAKRLSSINLNLLSGVSFGVEVNRPSFLFRLRYDQPPSYQYPVDCCSGYDNATILKQPGHTVRSNTIEIEEPFNSLFNPLVSSVVWPMP